MAFSYRCVTILLDYWLILSARPFLGCLPGFQRNLLVVQVDLVTGEVPGFQVLTLHFEVKIALRKSSIPPIYGTCSLSLVLRGSLVARHVTLRLSDDEWGQVTNNAHALADYFVLGIVRSLSASFSALDLPGLSLFAELFGGVSSGLLTWYFFRCTIVH